QIMAAVSQWAYVNFEDERLLDFQAKDFEMLNEVLVETYGTTRTYFFDEIQNVDRFESFVRRLQDEGKKVVITGSNASLLSKELGTRLTGRYKSFEVYPFSWSEYLAFKRIDISPGDWYDIDRKTGLLKQFQYYLKSGGLPEYLMVDDSHYVKTLVENILYRDIIVRYAIRKEKTLRELVNILATNVASPITYNALKKTLKLSNAITVKEYIAYLGNSYVFFELLRLSFSAKEQLASPRKIYVVDPAVHLVCGLTFSVNKGRNFENVVFLELRRKGFEAYYFAQKHECDFVVKSGSKVVQALQVCYALDDANRHREIGGLLEAMDAFGLDTGTILTLEQSDELTVDGKRITVLPFIRWALEGHPSSMRYKE
ncbi:MAG: ATP-binding protein, partial [Nanoarchaeota archaeon]